MTEFEYADRLGELLASLQNDVMQPVRFRLKEITASTEKSAVASEGELKRQTEQIKERLKEARQHRQQVLDGTTQNFDIDFRIVRPNGDIRHLEAHGSILKDGAGKPQCFVGLNRDITTRKKLDERLRHSEEISLQVSRIAQIGAWELRAADLELTWEPELFRIAEVELGYAPTLHKMAEFFVGIDQDMFLQAVQQAIQSGHSFDMDACPFTTALGRHRTVHVFGRAEFKDGRTVRILSNTN